MNLRFANFLSIVAHPIFINLLCLITLFSLQPSLYYGIPGKIKFYYIGYIFLLTSIIPSLSVVLMKLLGSVQNITLENKEDRVLPYIVTVIFYLFTYYNFRTSLLTSSILLMYLVACGLIVFSVLLINFYSKISIHMATLGALCGLIASSAPVSMIDIRWLLIFFIVTSGLVATARYSLNAHSFVQLFLGFILGFFTMFVFLFNLVKPFTT